MWGERRPNVILECFDCRWRVVRLEGLERWEGGEVGKLGGW